jgi:NADH-quinone oxidoreductase subunit B
LGIESSSILRNSPFVKPVDAILNWCREYSCWPYAFGTACCAIEFMAVAASHYDISRFGAEVIRFSPRQADLLVVSGTISEKMAPILKKIYDQICEPKWVLAHGACACSGGIYDNYCTVQGIDTLIPVDVYIPGCPPTPEAFLDGLIKIQKIIEGESIRDPRYRGE